MIQDIFPHTFHNEYRPELSAGDDSFVLCLQEKNLLAKGEDGEKEIQLQFPTAGELRGAGMDLGKLVYAFSVDEEAYFLYPETETFDIPGYSYLNILDMRKYVGNRSGMIAFTATHLYQWYSENRFCGKCGSRTAFAKRERALVCPACGRTIYPQLMPAVIVGVTNGDELLVTKYKEGFRYFALVAGFVEIGETLEECVAREVMEETGLRVKNIRYYKSQPWGIVKDLLAGFYCDVDGDTTIHIDPSELKVAVWKKREDIELQPGSYSLTNEMMRMFRDGKNN